MTFVTGGEERGEVLEVRNSVGVAILEGVEARDAAKVGGPGHEGY